MLAKALASATAAAPKTYIEDVFSTWLYTGNGSTQTITNGIDLSGKGGLVWYKSRNNAVDNALFDTARGAGKLLISNSTSAEGTGYAQSFTSSGFSLNNGGTFYNGSSYTYASWTFRKAEKFFDVVTYTGSGSAGKVVNHNLGSTPGVIILKRTDSSANWVFWHRTFNGSQYLFLDSDGPRFSDAPIVNFSNVGSSSFQIDSTWGSTNASGATYVAYLFAHDAGGFGDSGNDSVVSCGSFTTDGSGNATVNLGWEPQFVIAKLSSTTSDWFTFDAMRGFIVQASGSRVLSPNQSFAEYAQGAPFVPTSTGFTLGGGFGVSQTGIYIAIRRGPMKTPTDATKVFSANTWTGTGTTQQITTGFFPDACLTIDRNKNATNLNYLFDNLRGANVETYTNSTAAEGTDSGKAFTMTGLSNNSGNLNSTLGVYVGEFFRRASGFFDVVAYTGDGVIGRTVTHNLGVKPDLMIVKNRSAANAWRVYDAFNGATKYMTLNDSSESLASSFYWNNTEPTATTFTLRNNGDTNGSGSTYIAYLFASCPAVSKVGSYTGTGTTQQIDCGFTSGARFVMIKRIDSTGDWFVYDTARGIISGNDSYLLLNSTAAEVTNTDYIDPYSAGFEISSTAPAAINANGGSFIYLAVA